MSFFARIYHTFIGKPINPLNMAHGHKTYLIAFLAWVGLGADGLSSSCYGPEQSFLALGQYSSLGLYLALATAITVFVIAFAYNQIIELFPTGGGGYKVATALINPYAGLFSGTALLVDYALTIAISLASGMDAIFSFLPMELHGYKLTLECVLVLVLVFLNLRGLKESVTVLVPIFLAFVISHAFMIIYGIYSHSNDLALIIPRITTETSELSATMGWTFVLSLLLRAYSLGGGTYTGIEAVSNNINNLAEPRVKTGKWTMFYMATSLSFTAGGLILLYLLWHVTPEPGQTLNAVAFSNVMSGWHWGTIHLGEWFLPMLMIFEALLLLVAANTGFISGPTILANMAVDSWVPAQFRLLSSRLVIQNGLWFLGLVSIVVLWWTEGKVSVLVILYSINVFITFSFSLFGLCLYWLKNKTARQWHRKFALAVLGFIVTSSILVVTIVEKFAEGGWMTLFITALLFTLCVMIRRNYKMVDKQLQAIAIRHYQPDYLRTRFPPTIDPTQQTAVFFVDQTLGIGMNTLVRVRDLFGHLYKNYIFLGVGEVDAGIYGREVEIKRMVHTVNDSLRYFVNYCHNEGLPATSYCAYGTDSAECLSHLADKMKELYPNCTFFGGEIMFEKEDWVTKILHRDTSIVIQRLLHQKGLQTILLPINL